MRIRIVLTALVVAMVGWAGCRNLPTSPEAKDVLNTLSVSPDSTPQLQSGYIYWTDVAWGFVERWRDWRCGVESLIPFRYKYRYRYWLTIRTEDYQFDWYHVLKSWFIDVSFPNIGNVSDRDEVRRDWPIDRDHHIIETGYVFESCSYTTNVHLRVGRSNYSWSGRYLGTYITPPHTVHVRPLW